VSSRLADADYTAPPSAADNADAVWDEARSGHATAGTFGEGVASVQGDITGNVGGNVVGSVGSVSGNVGGNVAGSVGSLGTQAKADVNAEADAALADVGVTTTVTGRIDAAVSTRLATAGYTAPDNAGIAVAASAAASAASDAATAAAGTVAIFARTDVATSTRAAPSDVPTAAENADKLLGRNIAGGSDGGRTVTEALEPLRNRSDTTTTPGFLTVFKEDDATVSWVSAVTTAPGDPIVAVDPV
jgi:hypothetical protein